MKIIEEESLSWLIDYLPDKARYNLERLDEKQFNRLEAEINNRYPNGITLTGLVTLLKYNEELMLEMAGYYDED